MPQRSVYIREEDDEKWMACKEKSLLIHNALNQTTDEYAASKIKDAMKPIKTLKLEPVMKQDIENEAYAKQEPHVNFLKKKK